MMEFNIQRYNPAMADAWNQFVAKSKNGTFLFDRNYMDYHQDRFKDCSLMFYKKNRLYALLPANIVSNTLYSHQGLTYGGLIMDEHCTGSMVCQLYADLNAYLVQMGIEKVKYKAIPSIYHVIPAEEDLYALTVVCQAQLTSRDLSSTIVNDHHIPFPESRKSGIRKAQRNQLTITESDDLESFWNILNTNLQDRYQTHPVHTIEELRLLKSRFPNNIVLYIVQHQDEVLGGCLLYISRQVVHVQYISANEKGKESGALDLLFDELIHHRYKDVRFFDFGKSTTHTHTELNHQLLFQKEGFGGRGICYDTYEWFPRLNTDVLPKKSAIALHNK